MIARMTYNLVIPVWGKEYIYFFLETILPNWLSKNNLPKAVSLYRLSASIYTFEEDIELFQLHPHFLLLKTFLDVNFFFVEDRNLIKNSKYFLLSYCQGLSWQRAFKEKEHLILMAPDCLIADGGIPKCCSLIREGHAVIMIAAINRANREKISEVLADQFYDQETYTTTISNRELVKLARSHLHPLSESAFWEARKMSVSPSPNYWEAGGGSFLGKFFHIHPIAINFSLIQKNKEIFSFLKKDTIDGKFIYKLGVREEEIYPITSSEEFAALELTCESLQWTVVKEFRNKSFALARFAQSACVKQHRKKFLHLNFRYQMADDVDWIQIEKQAFKELTAYRVFVRVLLILRPFVLKIFR